MGLWPVILLGPYLISGSFLVAHASLSQHGFQCEGLCSALNLRYVRQKENPGRALPSHAWGPEAPGWPAFSPWFRILLGPPAPALSRGAFRGPPAAPWAPFAAPTLFSPLHSLPLTTPPVIPAALSPPGGCGTACSAATPSSRLHSPTPSPGRGPRASSRGALELAGLSLLAPTPPPSPPPLFPLPLGPHPPPPQRKALPLRAPPNPLHWVGVPRPAPRKAAEPLSALGQRVGARAGRQPLPGRGRQLPAEQGANLAVHWRIYTGE